MRRPVARPSTYTIRKTRRLAKLAVDRFKMLNEGETVVVGLSGGADSLCMLDLLNWYNDYRHKGWVLKAVHVHPGFDNWDTSRIARACDRIDVEFIEKRIDVPAKLEATKYDSCFFCARERRKALFRSAGELGTRKVALAHNMDDANETFLMNLMYASAASAFIPWQELCRGEIVIVRPLYYIDKPMVKRYLRSMKLRPVKNKCPFERTSSRQRLRRFLNRLYDDDQRIRTNIFWGMHNIKPKYLPRGHQREDVKAKPDGTKRPG